VTTDPTAVDRIPLAHSIHYAARGLPDVPNQYGRGILRPSEITLTYRAAPDSQLGRVHAYVAGRIHVDGQEIPHAPYGQYYDEGLDNWPEWLTAEARLHDPDAAADVAEEVAVRLHKAHDVGGATGVYEAMTELPRRGDQFEAWLKAQRDEHPRSSHAWFMTDCILDRYRLHADTGTPLGEHVCEGRAVGDCDCLETAPAVEAWDVPDARPGTTDHTLQQRHAVEAQPAKEADTCPAAHGALGRICELPIGHAGMHTGDGPSGGAVWQGDAS
jgi:hypothetical protein